MKVLQVHNFYRIRGGECSVVHAEKALLESRSIKVVPYYRDSRDIDDWGFLSKTGMLLDITYSRSVAADLESVVRYERPDVAHIHNVFPLLTPSVYRTLKRCGVPVVQTVHNFRMLCPNGQFYVRGRICETCQEKGFFAAIKKRCMQDSFLISTAYAAAIARAWKNGIFPNDTDIYIALNNFFAKKLIQYGVDESRIRTLGNFVSGMREAVPEKGNYVLYLGRLSREKGLHTLLRAWESVDGVVLKIAGSGPLENEVASIAKRLGASKVQMLGHVSGELKQNLIERALCMVVPSVWYENFPISVVEAMSCGTPVVASRIGGLPDMVKHEVSGLLFNSGDEEGLAMMINRVITDREFMMNLARNALNEARSNLQSQKHYEGLMDIYRQAMYVTSENLHLI